MLQHVTALPFYHGSAMTNGCRSDAAPFQFVWKSCKSPVFRQEINLGEKVLLPE